MKSLALRFKNPSQPFHRALAILWVALLAPGTSIVMGQNAPADGSAATTNSGPQEAWRLSNDQLDSLVAPIALYPDPLLSQTLVASTYPLEIIQLQQWLERNKNLKDQALADAVKQQPWDPSIQSMVAVPDVVERLAGNIQYTTELGNAFLAQPEDVMAAVQRMRAKAQGTNTLVSNTQQTVSTEVVEGGQEVIVIKQADPKVVYVPSYDPVVVYGAPAYPYPSYVYPGYVPGTGLAFGLGIALGAAWGNGWGYNCGWGGGDVNMNINNNNNYVSHYNRTNNLNNASGKWTHQAAHRGGAPYGRGGIKGVGGGTRPGGVGGIGGAGRPGGAGGIGGIGGVGRPGGAGGIGGAGGVGRPGGAGGISGAGGVGRPGGAGGISGGVGRPGGAGGAATRPSTRPSTQPGTRPSTRQSSSSIGGRSLSSGSSANRSAFSGSGYSASAARSSSSRGSSSMRSSGYSRGGGGGGARGGGGGGGRGRR